MQNTSTLYKSILAGEHTVERKVDVYNAQGTSLVHSFLKAEIVSISTARSVFSNSTPSVGGVISSEIDLELLPSSTVTIPQMAMLKPAVRLANATQQSEWIPKGTYWIDTRKTEVSGKIKIHGYDAMLKGEQLFVANGVVADWPRTDLQVLNGFTGGSGYHNGVKQMLGVDIDTASLLLINRGYQVQFPGTSQTEGESDKGSEMTVREVLSQIGSMYGGNWIINEENELQLIQLKTPTGTAYNIGQNVSSYGKIPAFDAYKQVELVVDEETTYYYPETETGRVLTVNCVWGTQAMAQNIYNIVRNYAYQPFTASNALLDPAAQLGDYVTVNGISSVLTTINTKFGALCATDIAADGEEEINHEYPFETKSDRAINRFLAYAKSSLIVTSSKIEAEVTRATLAEGVLSSRIEQTAESITSEVSRATAAEGQLSSRITQTAEELTISINAADQKATEAKQTADGFSLRITGLEGEVTSIEATLEGVAFKSSLAAGTTVINGGCIQTDTLVANTIKANSWVGLNVGSTGNRLANLYATNGYITNITSDQIAPNSIVFTVGGTTIGGNSVTHNGVTASWADILSGGASRTAVFG